MKKPFFQSLAAIIIALAIVTFTGCGLKVSISQDNQSSKPISSKGNEKSSSDQAQSSSRSNDKTTTATSSGILTNKIVDSLGFYLDKKLISIGDPVSKVTDLGYTVDDRDKNTTVDSSHYVQLDFNKGDKNFSLEVTSDKDSPTAITDGKIIGVGYSDEEDTAISLSNGICMGESLDDFNSKYGKPESDKNIELVDNKVAEYTFYGQDTTTRLEISFYDNKISTFEYEKLK